MFAQAGEITGDRVSNIDSCFRPCLALGNAAGKCGTGGHELAIFVLFQLNAEFHGKILIVSEFLLSIKDTGWETIVTGGVFLAENWQIAKITPY